MSIGARLRKLLDKTGRTQTNLAKTLDISLSTLNGYINDYREPDAKMLSRLAEELDTTVDYIINGDTAAHAGGDAYHEKVKVIAHNEGVTLTKAQEDAVARYMRFLVAEDANDEKP